MRFPRLRSAVQAADLAEIRDRAARAEDRAERAENEACTAAARIGEIFAEMDRCTAAAGLPRPPDAAPPAPRPQRHLSLVSDDRPGAA